MIDDKNPELIKAQAVRLAAEASYVASKIAARNAKRRFVEACKAVQKIMEDMDTTSRPILAAIEAKRTIDAPGTGFAPIVVPAGDVTATMSAKRTATKRERADGRTATATGHKPGCTFEATLAAAPPPVPKSKVELRAEIGAFIAKVSDLDEVDVAVDATTVDLDGGIKVGDLIRVAISMAKDATGGISPAAWEAFRGQPSTDAAIADLIRTVPAHQYRKPLTDSGYDWETAPAAFTLVVGGVKGEPLTGEPLRGMVRHCFNIALPPPAVRAAIVTRDDRHATPPPGGWTRIALVARAGELLGFDGDPKSLVLCNQCDCMRTTSSGTCPSCGTTEHRFYASELKKLDRPNVAPVRRRKLKEVPGVDQDRG